MSRETTKFKTPGGHEIEILTYLTGREQRDIDSILINEMMGDMDIETGRPTINTNLGEAQKKQEDKTIDIMVVSVDGKTGKILDTVLDLKAEDYNAIISEINKNTGITKKKEK